MAKTQTIIWTALPNGVTAPDARGNQKLKLSIFVAPRLETSVSVGALSDFPDFSDGPGKNWASALKNVSFSVQTETTNVPPTRATYKATVKSSADPALWDKCFKPSMPLKQHKFMDMSKTAVRSFSAASVLSTVKTQYANVAKSPELSLKVPSLAKLINLPGVTTSPFLTILPTQTINSSAVRSLAASPAPITQNTAFKAFEAYHMPYVVPKGFVPPTIPPMDFHRALSALGSYPGLMKKLGLVIEIEVPFTSAMKAAKRIRVIPAWSDGRVKGTIIPVPNGEGVVHKDGCQWTAYDIAYTATLPRRVTRFGIASRTGRNKNGYLVARTTGSGKDPVSLHNVDMDFAAARLMGTAANAVAQLEAKVASEGDALRSKGERLSAAALESFASQVETGLPALGQPVLGMTMNGLSSKVSQQLAVAATMNARLKADQEDQTVNYWEELARGYRIDVWDSVTRQWHPLCKRSGTYHVSGEDILWGEAQTLVDEGWVQLGSISKPEDVLSDEPPSEMRIHESVFDWSGWSLSVSRPGQALSEPDGEGNSTPTKTFTGPDGEEHSLGHYLHPDLPLDVKFTVPPGTLPRLRFGTTYRFRARAVDLAGNSLPFSAGSTTADPGGSEDTNVLVTDAITHQRFEPIKPPTVVLTEGMKPSESHHVLVVRTWHDPATGSPITQDGSRHITPPRASISMAEACGGLDATSTGKPMDNALWSTLCSRDDFDFLPGPDGHQQPHPTLASPVEYLPEPFAHGASISGLPGVAPTTAKKAIATGVSIEGAKIVLSATKSTNLTTLKVPFDDTSQPWYNKRPFRLNVKGVEATDARLSPHASPAAPVWNATSRTIEARLPKGDEVVVKASSYMSAAELGKMGVYQWGIETAAPMIQFVPKITIAAAGSSAMTVPVSPTSQLPAAANSLISMAKLGGSWMLSPPQEITMIHAVDLPMIPPVFTPRAHFERKAGETHATLFDWMQVHGKSTQKIDVAGVWSESVDLPSAGVPKWKETAVKKSAQVLGLNIEKDQKVVLSAGQPVPTSSNSTPYGPVPSPPMLSRPAVNAKGQRQFFGDTKHRKITYTATYTSRFDKYFTDIAGVEVKNTSAPKELHVPSSARPAPPVLKYIIPTFGWERTEGASTRKGGGLRVYLERPWFSSGDDERLGILLYQQRPYDAGYAELAPYITQWGNDPLWGVGSNKLPSARPRTTDFLGHTQVSSGLRIREYTGSPVNVVSYAVDYDEESNLWFADIVINQGKAYFPFVKLALARYQRYSIADYELSPVLMADFVQLTPDRTASATVAANGASVTLSVSGYTYTTADSGVKAKVTATLESRAQSATNAAWTPVSGEVELPRQALTLPQIITGVTSTTWAGTVALPNRQQGSEYRVVLREYEIYKRYRESEPGRRMVFAEAITIK